MPGVAEGSAGLAGAAGSAGGSVSAMSEDDPVEALYAAPPEGFVAARDALARALRAAGDRDGAARVRALRKPTRAAWALNAAVREQPGAARQLEQAVERLHDAQRELLDGGDAAVLRAAETALRDAGEELLAALPVDDPPTVERARTTLRAAAVDADVLADLVAGRLAHDQVVSGFGGFGDLAALAPPAAPRPRGGSAARADAAQRATAAREAAERDAAAREAAEREAEERAAAERAAAERAAAERQRAIEAARAEEADAEAAVAAAARAVEEAEAQLAARRAEREAATARLADARAARERAERA